MQSDRFSKRMPLELLCLSLLKERDMYGYEMVQTIEARSEKLLSVNITTLYVVLKKLCEKGYVSVHYLDSAVTRERLRLYYHFEKSADLYLAQVRDEYEKTTRGVEKFFAGTGQKRRKASNG